MGYENTIGKGYLTFEKFQTLLLMHPRTKHVEFDNFGELFLNKDLLKILQYSDTHKIMLSCAGGVNLNNASQGILEALARYRFQYLNISIDGASPETYSMYRKGGDFFTVIENIETINHYKKVYNSAYPKMQWQFIIFGHNEHEIAEAAAIAKTLGIRFYPKMNWNSEYSPIRDADTVKQQTGWDVTTREEYEKKCGIHFARKTCYSLWANPRYSWDLSVTGCCWNIWKRFDDYTIEYAKKELTGLPLLPTIPQSPCKSCEIYHNLLKSGMFLTKPEVLLHLAKQRMATAAKYRLWRMNI